MVFPIEVIVVMLSRMKSARWQSVSLSMCWLHSCLLAGAFHLLSNSFRICTHDRVDVASICVVYCSFLFWFSVRCFSLVLKKTCCIYSSVFEWITVGEFVFANISVNCRKYFVCVERIFFQKSCTPFDDIWWTYIFWWMKTCICWKWTSVWLFVCLCIFRYETGGHWSA